jgi:hypothetical protein
VSKRSEEIARRKQSLVEQANRERFELAAAFREMRAPFDMTSTLLGIGRLLRTHPIFAAGISSFLVSGYAGKLLKTSGEIVKVWRLALPLWGWWQKRRSK